MRWPKGGGGDMSGIYDSNGNLIIERKSVTIKLSDDEAEELLVGLATNVARLHRLGRYKWSQGISESIGYGKRLSRIFEEACDADPLWFEGIIKTIDNRELSGKKSLFSTYNI